MTIGELKSMIENLDESMEVCFTSDRIGEDEYSIDDIVLVKSLTGTGDSRIILIA